jgi:ferrous iron transport protein A
LAKDGTLTKERTLRDLKPGDEAKIVRLTGAGLLRQRLMDMGLIRGSLVLVKKFAPLGDPIEVEIRGYSLSLRKEEAAHIIVA